MYSLSEIRTLQLKKKYRKFLYFYIYRKYSDNQKIRSQKAEKISMLLGTKSFLKKLGMMQELRELLKYKLKESALVNVSRTDVLSKSIHLGVN